MYRKLSRSLGYSPKQTGDCRSRFNIDLKHHEALSDARACAKLYLHLMQQKEALKVNNNFQSTLFILYFILFCTFKLLCKHYSNCFKGNINRYKTSKATIELLDEGATIPL